MDAAPKGQELRDQGKLLEAREQFLVCADPACPPPVPTYCAEWLEDVKKKLPSIALRVVDASGKDVAGATITIDGKPASADNKPIDVDPGSHRVKVSRPGARDVEQTVVAAVGERGRVVSVKLDADGTASEPTKSGSPLSKFPTGSLIGWGVGAVGLLGFTAFGIKANLDYGSYESSCGHGCTTSDRDDVARTMVIADVFLAVGLVAAGVGTLLYFATPPPAERHARSTR
ncbi:MAG: PEGA domain-containing protein [Labilithrix sp.]|nr:PEGA domain-containing protein [Labilithrix sp.]MCW5812348.1 PEGA domain-containing protein [Labilithrix sp.]